MKTILTRLKTATLNNIAASGVLSYVRSVEVVHPDLNQTVHMIATFPRICFVPINSSEEWVASQEKKFTYSVLAYLFLMYHQRESSILGDASRPAGQGKGIIDFVDDFLSVFRGHRLAVAGVNYLDRPLDIVNVDYVREDLGANGHLLIAEVTMETSRLFLQTSLPGNV